MKRFLAATLLAFASTGAFAQTAHKATGVVTKSDPAGDRVTIRHEPVPSLNWPVMNMVFKVKDKSLHAKLPKDAKVEFEFVQQGRDYVVTSVK